jgi:hypothetical protein
MHNAGMIYGYARVSTAAQDESGQVAQLKAAGAKRYSARRSPAPRPTRPQLAKLTKRLASGDVVITPAVDRLSRDTTTFWLSPATCSAPARACDRITRLQSRSKSYRTPKPPCGRWVSQVFQNIRCREGRSIGITGRVTKIDGEFMPCLCELKLSRLFIDRFDSEFQVHHGRGSGSYADANREMAYTLAINLQIFIQRTKFPCPVPILINPRLIEFNVRGRRDFKMVA